MDAVEEVEVQVQKSTMNHKSKNVVVAAEVLVEVLADLIWPTTLLPQEDVVMAATEKDASTIERAVFEEPFLSVPRLQTVKQHEICRRYAGQIQIWRSQNDTIS